MSKDKVNKAKQYFYKEGIKNVGKEKTISGLKQAFGRHTMAKKMGKKENAVLPKHKWGVKQGNFMKVHPLDRK